VPAGYASNAALSDSNTFNFATFASLGLTPGTSYTYTWGSGAHADSFIINVGSQSVPDTESTVTLLLIPVGLILCYRRRSQAPSITAA
jgi:hypothetical protein